MSDGDGAINERKTQDRERAIVRGDVSWGFRAGFSEAVTFKLGDKVSLAKGRTVS